jgi:hypothetical protein
MRTLIHSNRTKNHSTDRAPSGLQLSILALATAGALLVCGAAAAGPGVSDAQARYQKDRAACLSGDTNQDRATCLREAGAALVEARRGGLTTTDDSTYVKNSMEDCVRRMRGEGTVIGSVEEGGIYRELHRTVPLDQADK